MLSVTILLILVVMLIRRNIHRKTESPIVSTPACSKYTVRLVSGAAEYSAILTGITGLVENFSPGAKWVFEAPNARSVLKRGEDVFILLNRAGGYRRIKVLHGGGNLALELPQHSETEMRPLQSTEEAVPVERPDPAQKENFGLLAFEWTESNILTLNERCNEAIAHGKTELILAEDELPASGSWSDICKELKQNGIEGADIIPDGIKLILRTNNAERK